MINTARSIATLTIPGNDDPYGVIGWRYINYLSQASSVKNETTNMTITRSRGLIGSVVIGYQAITNADLLHSNEKSAKDGIDYVLNQKQVVIPAGMNSTDIQVDIIHVSLSYFAIVLSLPFFPFCYKQ